MLKVKKLHHYNTFSEIIPGESYAGKVLKNKLIELSNTLKARISQDNDLKEGEIIAVKVKKISPPNIIELEKIDEEFEVIDEEKKDLSSIGISDVGQKYTTYCKIKSIQQTSGPTLFTLFDGSGTIVAKSFVGPGKRAYPNLNNDDNVKAILTIKEKNGNIEAEFNKYERLEEKNDQQLTNKINKVLEQQAMPEELDFLIKSEILEKLKPEMINIAKEIKKAILESRPIIIRHHADCDGYCGGVAFERAIIPLIIKQHKNENAQWFYYKRAPSPIPFYDYGDATKDLTSILQDMSRHGRKEPLIILIDNGSTEEDLMGIKKVKIYDAKVIVVDHHFTDKNTPVNEFLDCHVNPYLVDGDSNLTAGMLCTEIARFINKDVENIKILAALAGIGDRSTGTEFEQYINIAKELGFDKEYLISLAESIDFEAHYLRFMESRNLISDLLGNDLDKQKKLISLMKDDIQKKREEQLLAIKHFIDVKEDKNLIIAKMNISSLNLKGGFPTTGKTTGIAHDYIKSKYDKQVITLGYGPDFVTIRATDNIPDFNLNNIISELREKKPYGLVNGGGHKVAGTIKFIEAVQKEVLEFIDEYIKRFK